MKILSIDPSIKSLGWAEFSVNCSTKKAILINVGYFQIRKGDWIIKLDQMISCINMLMKDINIVLIELPHIYTVGKKGIVAGNSESIMKLSSFVFAARQRILDQNIKVELIPVSKWKGNVPKLITKKRVEKHWNFISNNNDIIDAVGIGDYWIRKENYVRTISRGSIFK